MLQARLLGQYEIRMDGQPVIISSRPMQSLIAYLVLHPHISHRREKLAGQIWPDASESNARSNLRHALWLIRKAIGPGANVRIESDDLGVTYHPQPGDQLDVDCFEACSEEEGSTDALIQAVSAYGGDLLPGFYEEWVILEREWLQAAFERKMGRLLDCLLAERRWNEVLAWGERWIASGGTPEPAYRALMLAHAGLGNLSGAVAQYQRCVEAMDRDPTPIFGSGWEADYPDLDNFLRASTIRRDTRWRNKAYDELVEESRRVMDQGERMKLYGQADRILVEEAAIMPLIYARKHLLVKPWVSKFPTSPMKWNFWKDVIIEPH